MTTHDIFVSPEDYWFVQFNLDNNGYMHPIGAIQFTHFVSSRYPELPFVSPKASRFGLRRRKGATHWAVVCSTNDETIVLHHGMMKSINRKKRIIPFNYGTDYYLILRGSTDYIKVMVATQPSPESSISSTTLTQKAS